MLKQGRYIAENNGSIFDKYRIVIEVKETEKSYIFTMLEYENRYSHDHFALLFKGTNKATIAKNKGGHAMRVRGDDAFTIYPFQAGIPFYFKLMQN